MESRGPINKVGDFVVCDFEYLSFVRNFYDQNALADTSVYHGIVVDVDWSFYEYMEEYVYEILCLDGEKRYFMESELMRVK